jgi:ribosome biogenesis GTPase
MTSPSSIPGVILKAQSGFFTVHTEAGDFVCQLRGKLKHHRQKADLAAIGDTVEISTLPDGAGRIESVAPRRTALMRRAPTPYGRPFRDPLAHKGQVIIANPDALVFVFACAEPTANPRLIDRFLVVAEAAQLPVVICANKRDKVTEAEAHALFGLYPPLGYRVLFTSAKTGLGLAELRELLRGKISVFAGQSGVGKSSLLNALQPGLGLHTREVSAATTKGRHTTVHPELIPLEGGGYVADTPGLRTIAPWDVEPEELDAYFVDLRLFVEHCAFSDCSHIHEPGCAVREAVEAGKIAPSRYDSYCRLRRSEKEALSDE